jgi:hypothetical protein
MSADLAAGPIGSSVRAVARTEVSLPRIYALRAGYLLLVVGLGSQVWPGIVHHDTPWALMHGVVNCMLGALSLLAVLGLRHPVKMLPLLFFEMAWKAIWLLVVALPAWSAHQMDEDTAATVFACLIAVIYPLIMPWSYILAQFGQARGDRWR